MKNSNLDLPKRECHNCRLLYQPIRHDQKHCDRLCGDRCRPCHRVFEKDRYKRLALQKRKTLRGLAASALDLVKTQAINRGKPEDVDAMIAELEALKTAMERNTYGI